MEFLTLIGELDRDWTPQICHWYCCDMSSVHVVPCSFQVSSIWNCMIGTSSTSVSCKEVTLSYRIFITEYSNCLCRIMTNMKYHKSQEPFKNKCCVDTSLSSQALRFKGRPRLPQTERMFVSGYSIPRFTFTFYPASAISVKSQTHSLEVSQLHHLLGFKPLTVRKQAVFCIKW